mmetsp:Transcript_16995/g.14925  ORF Transcript_16995/g.14925 Transcript_16995/m.14925 type:complete len:130 (+) Transcript_16995:590-979(+)
MHSSILSSSGRSNNEIPNSQNDSEKAYQNFSKETKLDLRKVVSSDSRSKELEIKEDKTVEYDDFTENQKGYINKLLDEKLDIQREKMINYFQNIQLEMIRQFQMQYLELSDVIEGAVEGRKKEEFYDKY